MLIGDERDCLAPRASGSVRHLNFLVSHTMRQFLGGVRREAVGVGFKDEMAILV